MHRQVAVFKKYVSFWLVSRVPEAIFLLLVLVLSNGLAQLSTDRITVGWKKACEVLRHMGIQHVTRNTNQQRRETDAYR